MAHAHTAHADHGTKAHDSGSHDAHGGHAGGGHHGGHVIVGPFTLRTVLLVLLVLTVATVGQALVEQWVQTTFNILLPKWINVAIVLAIATVKGLLVMAYFMQLRYDNPINTILMLFCFFAFGLFLGLTGIDVFNRGTVYEYKAQVVQVGGTGSGVQARTRVEAAAGSSGRLDVGGKNMVEAARERWAKQWGPDKFKTIEAAVGKHGHGPLGVTVHHESSARASRPRVGLTGATDLEGPTPTDGHGDGHGGPASHGSTPAKEHGGAGAKSGH